MSTTIHIENMMFQPSVIHVPAGTTVVWKNEDTMTHTVTSGANDSNDNRFDSGDLQPGQTFSYTFQQPGSYAYFCDYHPMMQATVIVEKGNHAKPSADTTGAAEGMNMSGSTMSDSSSDGSTQGEHIAVLGTGTHGESKGPDGAFILPYQWQNGYKVFHLTAEPVWWKVKDGKVVEAWAFNGSVPGPEIRVNQGDKVKIVVTNKLPEDTTVHWHGLDVPFSQDGDGMFSQPGIHPGQTWTYEFTVHTPPGTYMYHSHPMNDMAKQERMGMFGPFIVEPKGTGWKQTHPGYQDEFTLVLNDSPQFGYTINGKSFPTTPVLKAKLGDKVLVHIANTGSMYHPMHLHGFHFQLIGQDGYPVPRPMWLDTLTVAPGATYDIAFTADQPGKWLFHCHIMDHVTEGTQMSGMITMFDVK
jgi:FtsP/CotA-like multicopper oxidase with cupredoxin domain